MAKEVKEVKKTAIQSANKKIGEAIAKIKKAKSLKDGKIKCVILKGYSEKFGSEKIIDGSELNLPIDTAKELLIKGFITVK